MRTSSQVRLAAGMATLLFGCDRGIPQAGHETSPVLAPSGAPAASAPAGEPARSVATTETATPPAPSAPPSCKATRAFTGLAGSTEYLKLPAAAGATACEALEALVPDYDAATESSKKDGTVRADEGFSVEVAGRSVWALPYYVGKEAEELFLCGCCEAHAKLALFEVVDGKVAVVARATAPISHAGLGTGLRPSPFKLKLDINRELVLVESANTCGTAPLRKVLHGFTAAQGVLKPVLSWRVGARGSTRVADISEVSAVVSNEEQPGGAFDLLFSWRRADCPFDDKAGEYVCAQPQPYGTERLRFDGSSYKLRGPEAKLEHLTLAP